MTEGLGLEDDLEKAKKDNEKAIEGFLENPEGSADNASPSNESGETPENPKPEKEESPREGKPLVADNENSDEEGLDIEPVPGVSSAYASKGLTTKSEKRKWVSKPPKRDKHKTKLEDGDNIMEVFWNEMLNFYKGVIDFSVDLVLDAAAYFLYLRKEKTSQIEEKGETPFEKGTNAYEKWKTKYLEGEERVLDAWKETKDNLELIMLDPDKKYDNLKWKNKKGEPFFFKKLVEAKEKALQDPNCPEAKFIEKFEKFPQYIKTRYENSLKLGAMAFDMATIQEFVEQEKFLKTEKDPQKIAEYKAKADERITQNGENFYRDMANNILKIQKEHQGNPEEQKKSINEYVQSIGKQIKALQEQIRPIVEQKGSKKEKTQVIESLENAKNSVNEYALGDRKIGDIAKPTDKRAELVTKDSSYSDIMKMFKDRLH